VRVPFRRTSALATQFIQPSDQVGKPPRKNGQTTGQQVVGAGFAGLVAARMLSAYADQVILLDRDTIPSGPTIRRGTPQAHHQHHLLPGGLAVLARWFPNLIARLDKLGGQSAGPSEWYAYTPRGKTYRVSRFQPSPIAHRPPLRMQSRALLEYCLRQDVEQLPNVTCRYDVAVDGVLWAQRNVCGVTTSNGAKLSADLVIDASGRVSRTLGWLKQAGYATPPASVVNCDFAYASMFFRPADASAVDGTGFMVSSAQEGEYTKRGGSLVNIEDGRWLVTLAGRLGDYPPKDEEGFFAYVRTLHTPIMAELLAAAEPDSAPHQYRFPASVNRHYERLEAFPEGLLPVGDAICHINPGYAQGMSYTCRQLEQLDQILRARKQESRLRNLWPEFFACAYQQSRAPWLFAALVDFSKQGTTGDFPEHERPAITRLRHLSALADRGDAAAADLVDAVFDMERPLSALL
ncbi:MAG: hypothetical protein AAF993_06280, partial [Pseudomonadota bacterium]